MQIIWSRRTTKSYLKTLEYILQKWTIKEAEAFEKDVFAFIKTLLNNKLLCPVSKIMHLRKCVLSKQTSIIYKVTGTSITLVALIDNRSKHTF